METSYLKTLELDKIIARAAEGCVPLIGIPEVSLNLVKNVNDVVINLFTEILSVKDTGSFAGLRNSLKITRYNTTTVFAWIVL